MYVCMYVAFDSLNFKLLTNRIGVKILQVIISLLVSECRYSKCIDAHSRLGRDMYLFVGMQLDI